MLSPRVHRATSGATEEELVKEWRSRANSPSIRGDRRNRPHNSAGGWRAVLKMVAIYAAAVGVLAGLSGFYRLTTHLSSPGFTIEKRGIETYHLEVKDLTRGKTLEDKPSILILSPIRQAMSKMNQYEDHVRALSYPHDRISIAFLVGDGDDGTYEYLRNDLSRRFVNQYGFKKVTIIQHNVRNSIVVKHRHRLEAEKMRRTLLSKIRNTLLRTALTDEDYVVWLDHDLDYFPGTIIEEMIDTQKQCVIPVSLESPGGRTYDRNNWIETPESIEHQKKLPEDFILYEGHGHEDPDYDTKRNYLRDVSSDFRNYREIVRLDGVGSTILLIDANLHRHGLIFPEFPVRHQIESEGLARIAVAMGSSCWGMPNMITIHHQPDWPNIWRE